MIATARCAFVALCTAMLVSACGGSNPDAARNEAAAKAQAQAYTTGQLTWREQHRAELTTPDGWTTLVGLHWIDPGSHYVGSDDDNGISLAVGPEHIGLLERKGDRIRFVPERGAAVTLDGQPVKGGVTLRSDDAPEGPSTLAFDEGKGLINVIRRGDRFALSVRHADAPTRTHFKGIEYWPGGQDWVVEARYLPNAPGKMIAVADLVGTVDDKPNPGAVEFEREGQTYRLEALDVGGDKLFFVFHDRTSGKGSYSAGRYLDAPKPDARGRVVLDFNKAYNPPCAFTAYATCSLPPPENRLNLEVVAGEKNYSFKDLAQP